jgi:DNA-binding response OmpR family regulator
MKGMLQSRGGEIHRLQALYDMEPANATSSAAKPRLARADTVGATILVVEDHRATRTFLADNLTADGYDVLAAECFAEAMRLLDTKFPDLALVDLGLPDRDGLELISAVRDSDRDVGRANPDLPVIVLSGRAGDLEQLRGFRRGCDDFVCKPFDYHVLLARIVAVLRRTERRPTTGRLRIGSLEFDPLGRQVWVAGEPVTLSNKEYALLRALATDPTRVFTRQELLRGVWGFKHASTTRTLDSHAARLRGKLNRGGASFVINVWGIGYRLIDGGISS